MSDGLSTSVQTVTVVKQENSPTARFQVVPYAANGANVPPIFTCRTQGEVVSWLSCHGYKWVNNTHPQQWTKV